MRRSKKRSGANSDPLLDEPVYFLDRSLGRNVVADLLRARGMTVEIHDDHLAQDAPDEEWIALVGRRRWVAVTKDRNIRYRTGELEAVRRRSARVLVLRMKDATGAEMAELLVRSRRRIIRFVSRTPAPFVAGIARSGSISRYDTG